VKQIDLASVVISRADGASGSVGPNEGPPGPHSVFEDVGTPFDGELCDCHALGGDGIADLSLKFKTQDVVAVLGLDAMAAGELPELVVSGTLLDGTRFAGSDCVRLVPSGTPPGLFRVESNAAGAWVDVAPLDNELEGGGFADFERSYPQSTVVTLTASESHGWRPFRGWRIDGGTLVEGSRISLAIRDTEHVVEAVYAQPSCGLGFELALLLPGLIWLRRTTRSA
jgi:hypothetical protein